MGGEGSERSSTKSYGLVAHTHTGLPSLPHHFSPLIEKDRLAKKGPGMTSFYANMLAQSEAEHAAAVSASSSKPSTTSSSGPSLTIRPPTKDVETPKLTYDYDPEPEADSWLLREAAAKKQAQRQAELLEAASTSKPIKETLPGGVTTANDKIEINDEGSIVDKRVLLKAGLNITKKPAAGMSSLVGRGKEEAEQRYQSRAVGASASYAERNARERERLERMLAEEKERERKLKEEKMKEVEMNALKRKQGGEEREEGDLKRKAARERFEERKRRRLEEEAEVEAKRLAEGGNDPA